MKFLADMGISPKTVLYLNKNDYDAVHLFEQKLERISDSEILKKAKVEDRIILTHDLDFGELIAASHTILPSVVIFRLKNMHPDNVNHYLNQILNKYKELLLKGVIVSVSENNIRVRKLPIET
jgi:predicted nuclease of predicted toxin-antitoxin system